MWTAIKTMLAGSWLKIAQWGSIAAALLAAYYSIRKGGRDAERAEQAERTIRHANDAAETRNDVNRLSAAAVRDRLRARWQRD